MKINMSFEVRKGKFKPIRVYDKLSKEYVEESMESCDMCCYEPENKEDCFYLWCKEYDLEFQICKMCLKSLEIQKKRYERRKKK